MRIVAILVNYLVTSSLRAIKPLKMSLSLKSSTTPQDPDTDIHREGSSSVSCYERIRGTQRNRTNIILIVRLYKIVSRESRV